MLIWFFTSESIVPKISISSYSRKEKNTTEKEIWGDKIWILAGWYNSYLILWKSGWVVIFYISVSLNNYHSILISSLYKNNKIFLVTTFLIISVSDYFYASWFGSSSEKLTTAFMIKKWFLLNNMSSDMVTVLILFWGRNC